MNKKKSEKKANAENKIKDEETTANDTAEKASTDTESVDNEEAKAEDEQDEKEENPLEKELADTKDQLLRITAEYANFRKRSEKEKSESFNFATAKAVGEILGVVDNLERALASEQEDYDTLKKGVQMTYDSLMASLEKLGVTVYGEKGDTFDPNFHNAVMHEKNDEMDANIITDVFQKGYKINDKVVRPAMVKTVN
ncbi:MAG: nucleotide exchange factor GrpE [Clostridiales bacterium]|nr:nucleotide exchange factor GrpE [Clostridiales bacterium]